MIGCLRTRVRNQPIIALYFESENELKFYNLEVTVSAMWLFLTMPCIGLQCMIMVFPGHTHLLYDYEHGRLFLLLRLYIF